LCGQNTCNTLPQKRCSPGVLVLLSPPGDIRRPMKKKLTVAVLDALVCPEGKPNCLVFDSEITGFSVRVSKSGTKRFLLQFTRRGRTKRLVLGKYGEITLHQARQKALVALGEVVDGGDPVAARKARAAAIAAEEAQRRLTAEEDAFTVKRLLDAWADAGLKAAGVRHQMESPRAIGKLLKAHLSSPAWALTQAQAQRAVDDLALTAPAMAARSRNYARAAFGWAARRKLIAANPFANTEILTREHSRSRVLSDAELGEAWRAAGGLADPWREYFQLVILTLQRRGEVAGMEWAELSADFAAWTIPAARAKNGKAHIVHLSEPARAILRTIPRREKSRFVLTTTGTGPINSFTRAKEWLHAKILLERGEAASDMQALDWTVHDFRRTGVTVLAGMGFAIHVADKLLNHVQGAIRGVAAVYQRNEFLPERARALDAWAAYVLRQAEGKADEPDDSNVVRLTG
jgi:integrase